MAGASLYKTDYNQANKHAAVYLVAFNLMERRVYFCKITHIKYLTINW